MTGPAHQATIQPTVLLESTVAGFPLDCGTSTHLGGGALSGPHRRHGGVWGHHRRAGVLRGRPLAQSRDVGGLRTLLERGVPTDHWCATGLYKTWTLCVPAQLGDGPDPLVPHLSHPETPSCFSPPPPPQSCDAESVIVATK